MDLPADQLGRPLRDLRISVTDRCNFRCPYCMPEDVYGERYQFLPKKEILSYEEISRLARLCVELGARKIRITGGEPLLRPNLSTLLELLSEIDSELDLALTTNGVLLPKHASQLRSAGLGRVTVSLDSLDEDVQHVMSGGRSTVGAILEGIAAAEAAGFVSLKINCVVQRGVNDGGVVDLARRFRGTGHVVRFIEYMDVGNRNRWTSSEVVPSRDVIERIDAVFPLEAANPSYPGEVARRWVYRDGAGEIGVIASITQPFCGDCTRARLTTDGQLVTCLFATGGRDLKRPLREGASDDEIRERIAGVWRDRRDRYSEDRAEREAPGADAKIEMYQIGG